MLDSDIHPHIEKSLDRTARFLAARGFDANMISLIGAGMMVPAFAALVFHAYTLAIVFIVLSRLCDGLDGVVAKYQPGGPTDFGHLLDSVLDYVFYGGVVFFFALGQPSTALTAAFLIFSITSNGISFLVLSAISEKRGSSPQTLPTHQKKNLRYSGGLPEGFETILLFISMCLLPNGFVPMAIIFSLFCWVTIVMRLSKARFQLAAKPSETAP